METKKGAQLVLALLLLKCTQIGAKDTTSVINGKKVLNVVNEEFLSFSVDQETLMQGLNLSSTAVLSGEYLSPAFIRISGISERLSNLSGTDEQPNTWKSLNQWIKMSGFTPIFAINEGASEQTTRLLNMNEKMAFDCYWQLNYDRNGKSLGRYAEDLITFKHALDEYSSSKLIGSNLCSSFAGKALKKGKGIVKELGSVLDAVTWGPQLADCDLALTPPNVPIWLILPKSSDRFTFDSGLSWAKQIGEAASEGYKVVFRQPTMEELFLDTPVFWISALHKALIGRTVLEVTTNAFRNFEATVHAYCTKSNFKRGAMVLFVVNNGKRPFITSLRVGGSHPKNIDVLTYTLTSNDEDPSSVYLNGEKLTTGDVQDDNFLLLSKLQNIRAHKLLNLRVPPKSVTFFVLPDANIPVCSMENRNLKDKLEKPNTSIFDILKQGLKLEEASQNEIDKSSHGDDDQNTLTNSLLANTLRQFLFYTPNLSGRKAKNGTTTLETRFRDLEGDFVVDPITQKKKRFVPLLGGLKWRKLKNRRRDRRHVNEESGRNCKNGSEILQPGEKYVDEKLEFLMEPSGFDPNVEEENLRDYHTFFEDFDDGYTQFSRRPNELKREHPGNCHKNPITLDDLHQLYVDTRFKRSAFDSTNKKRRFGTRIPKNKLKLRKRQDASPDLRVVFAKPHDRGAKINERRQLLKQRLQAKKLFSKIKRDPLNSSEIVKNDVKRSVYDGADSAENMIDSSSNSIHKFQQHHEDVDYVTTTTTTSTTQHATSEKTTTSVDFSTTSNSSIDAVKKIKINTYGFVDSIITYINSVYETVYKKISDSFMS